MSIGSPADGPGPDGIATGKAPGSPPEGARSRRAGITATHGWSNPGHGVRSPAIDAVWPVSRSARGVELRDPARFGAPASRNVTWPQVVDPQALILLTSTSSLLTSYAVLTDTASMRYSFVKVCGLRIVACRKRSDHGMEPEHPRPARSRRGIAKLPRTLQSTGSSASAPARQIPVARDQCVAVSMTTCPLPSLLVVVHRCSTVVSAVDRPLIGRSQRGAGRDAPVALDSVVRDRWSGVGPRALSRRNRNQDSGK